MYSRFRQLLAYERIVVRAFTSAHTVTTIRCNSLCDEHKAARKSLPESNPMSHSGDQKNEQKINSLNGTSLTIFWHEFTSSNLDCP
ncbi:unnamed protein product [Protopolystoma xenopodis]|uniref:Uncharacterized protein n=1 Tax=Protopolystoma xenopodis TaxID=117903 RepID=A0A448XS02_9PLAT|nr:unnamed protein product [Protopolystoma xenopodis]